LLATAYVFKDIFDEYDYHSINPTEPAGSYNSQNDETENAALEIPLNTLIECLNIFGTASTSSLSTFSKLKQWKRADDNSDNEGNEHDAPNRNRGVNGGGRIDQYFSGSENRTGMRLSYAGAGHPLTLLV
jgi:cell cycle checkpoint protein